MFMVIGIGLRAGKGTRGTFGQRPRFAVQENGLNKISGCIAPHCCLKRLTMAAREY